MSRTDTQSRRTILTDFSSTLFVDAGAGSGKTTAMVSRIMMLLLRGLADIREVVAMTFTNEGAASLKSRIQQELEKAHADGSYAPQGGDLVFLLPEEKERIERALLYLPLAHFTTIHGFCVTLLKERPIEAGVDPKFDMNTEGNIVPTLRQGWAQYLLQCARQSHSFLPFALEHDIDLGELEGLISLRIQYLDLHLFWEDVDPMPPKEIEAAFRDASELIRDMVTRLPNLEKDGTTGAGVKRIQAVKTLSESIMAAQAVHEKLMFLMAMETHDTWKKDQSFFAQSHERLAAITERVRKRHLDFLHANIAKFVEEFTAWFARYKKATSTMDFDDLLHVTREMLRVHPHVREYFKRRFRYLFVDETQDTDPLQMEIIFFLGEREGMSAAEWSDVTLTPGKLFMVGDPKQSIFKFRRADITMYEKAKRIVQSQGGKVLSLDRNFRSAPDIVQLVNSHFTESFRNYSREQELLFHPQYVPLTAAAPSVSNIRHHIYGISSPESGGKAKKSEVLEHEIGRMISMIRWLTGSGGPRIVDPVGRKERPIEFRDIMVLMRAMTDYSSYERFFEEAGIPHFQVGGKTFFDTEDVRACVHALQAIDDPTDSISLYGALKSPLFGFSDQDIVGYVRSGKPLALFAGEEEGSATVSRALFTLHELHRRKESLGPSGVLKGLYDATGICHVVLSEPNGVQKAARHFRLMELVRELEAHRTSSFRGVVAELREVMSLSDPQLANVVISQVGNNAVKFTTIHKAKGLEAPVVILANGISREREPEYDHFVLRDEQRVVIPYHEEGGFYSKDRQELEDMEAMRERSESERLRYVAATRARDILVICYPTPEQGQNTFNGVLAPSLLLNPKVGTVGSPGAVINSGHGSITPVNLQQVYDATRDRINERTRKMSERMKSAPEIFVSVHERMAIDRSLFAAGGRESKGTAFGRLIHRMMEQYVLDPAFHVDLVLNGWMEEEGVRSSLKSRLLLSYERTRTHPLVLDAVAARKKYCEWEYFLRSGGTIENGVIDCVFERRDGWVILDYKTDDVSDPQRLEALADAYGRQLQVYEEAFNKITGHRVKLTSLVFTEQTG